MAGDFNAPGVCWSTFAVSKCLLLTFANIQRGGWIQHVAEPTRNKNILENFLVRLTHFCTSTEDRFPGCNHLPVSRTFTLPFHIGIPSKIARPYLVEKWGNLLPLLRTSNYHSFFLASGGWMATDKLCSLLNKCLGSIMLAQTNSMPNVKNSHDRRSRKVARL